MQKRTLKVAVLAALALILVLSFSGVALADQTWSDLPDTVTAKYGVTDNQVAAISEGFGSLWKPNQAVTRAQFAKMAVAAFGIDKANPATATYTDVPKGSFYYEYIEGAKAAGVINGTTATTFSPSANITRQQAIAIVSRYVAMANGYDLATMYTATDIDHLLAHFGDAASISASLKAEVAFAYDMGLTKGDAYGNVAPLANLSRIQGAAFLIRAQGLVPPANWTAAKIELVSEDKSENLIGQFKQLTYKVTDAAGHPAANVLVDFDTLVDGQYYVGNVSNEAAMTNSFGEVTINLLSTEVGTERVSAAVSGVAAIYTTAYWLALDEVYILDTDLAAENNAGDAHDWAARVVVFGPGPRSTSANDWYNAIDATFDPANVNVPDGVDVSHNVTPYFIADGTWTYAKELALALTGYAPRTLAGIDVEWAIVNVVNDNPLTTTIDETVPSVGEITAVTVPGTIAANKKSAVGKTNAAGLSTITIESTVTGKTTVEAVADYAGNPYPEQLFTHVTGGNDYQQHYYDWDDQPSATQSVAVKTWIPHVIGGDSDAPITPLYAVNNTGEVETFTLSLKDTFGNVIPGYTVEWWIQGVGFFKSDGTTWVGTGEQNKDVDVTDAAGKATLDLKSLVPGQTIVHVKVMDKYGLPYKEWNVVKQWYSIDDVSLGNIDALGVFHNSATNLVNTTHTWTAYVSGAKYVYTMYDLNKNGLRDDKVLIGDRADMTAKAGNYANFDGTVGATKPATGVEADPKVGVPFMPNGGDTWYIRFADMTMLDNEFWMDEYGTVAGTTARVADGIDEVWAGLAGKDVYFYNNQYLDATLFDTPRTSLVGTITSATKVVTDANGEATVTINSTNKGTQTVVAVADYSENPQDGDPLKPTQFKELRWAAASKLWTADYTSTPDVRIFAQGILGAANGYRWTNPILPFDFTGTVPVTIGAPLPVGTAATGTAVLSGVTVASITVNTAGTGYTASDIGRAVTIAAPASAGSGAAAIATLGTTGPTNNQVGLISVTAGGTGYTVAPTVVIGAPQIPGGTQAAATATVALGSVVSITLTNVGSGYTSAPAVSFSTATSQATATIATLAADGVATVTVTAPGTGYTVAPLVTFPLPLKTAATATATATNGVITSITLVTGGAGYITPPAVIFGGTGSGAAATATVANGVVTGFTNLVGGTGYMGASTVDPQTGVSANPNRETFAVSVFDQYGNALQGYKVTFEIVGQGTTTAGTINTYHPYAHFENPLHTAGTLTPGLGDLNPWVNANPAWNRTDSLLPQPAAPAPANTSDDDYAWGYTLNHEINYVTNPAYAATVDLVMDETRAALEAKATHFTNIVNIQVFNTLGVRVLEKEVTKVWSTDLPQLTTIVTNLSTTANGPWLTAVPATSIQPINYRVQLYDQYGAPWTGTVTDLIIRFATPAWGTAITHLLTAASDADGVITGTFAPAAVGTWNVITFNDTINPGSDSLDALEIVSPLVTYILQ